MAAGSSSSSSSSSSASSASAGVGDELELRLLGLDALGLVREFRRRVLHATRIGGASTGALSDYHRIRGMKAEPSSVEVGSVYSSDGSRPLRPLRAERPSGDRPRIGEQDVCGIAGYSLSGGVAGRPDSRDADAPGRDLRARLGRGRLRLPRPGRPARRAQAARRRERAARPPRGSRGDARQALVHVRDYTKGHPSLTANNHPIRHGSVVGIHNGIIANDEEILAGHGFERAEPGHDRRLRGDLRPRGRGVASTRLGPRGAARLHGRRLARRARSGDALPRPRDRPAALARRGRERALLRLDAGGPRPRRALRGHPARASASSARERCWRSRTEPSARTESFEPDRTFVEARSSRPSARPRRAAPPGPPGGDRDRGRVGR